MNTKFTILIAAGLLFAGVSQAQNAVAYNKMDIRNPRHEMVRDHKAIMNDHKEIRNDRKEIRKDRKQVHKHKAHRHHKGMKHHHKKFGHQ